MSNYPCIEAKPDVFCATHTCLAYRCVSAGVLIKCNLMLWNVKCYVLYYIVDLVLLYANYAFRS